MKTYFFSLLLVGCFFGTAPAQNGDQNPRAALAYEAYKDQTGAEHAASMGATIDNTYEAYDPIQIKKQRRQDRIDFRRQLRLERARRPRFIIPNRRWGWRYGW
jgi:hypothetical protein